MRLDTSAAVCRDYHSDFWFPPPFADERDGKESEYYEIAKVLCYSCPLLKDCAAIGKGEEHGMWGGWTPRERNKGMRKPPTKTFTDEHLAVIPEPNPRTPLGLQYVKADLKAVTVRLRKKP